MKKRRWENRSVARWWRYGLRLGIAMLFFWTILGTVGFIVLENWTLSDAFYMTVITSLAKWAPSALMLSWVFGLSRVGAAALNDDVPKRPEFRNSGIQEFRCRYSPTAIEPDFLLFLLFLPSC